MPGFREMRQAAYQEAGLQGGDFLDKDELVRSQLPFVVTRVRENNGQFGAEWRLDVEPLYEEDEEPKGTITLKRNELRDAVMLFIKAETETDRGYYDNEGKGLVMVHGRSKSGNQYHDLDEPHDEPEPPQGPPQNLQQAQAAAQQQAAQRQRPSRSNSQTSAATPTAAANPATPSEAAPAETPRQRGRPRRPAVTPADPVPAGPGFTQQVAADQQTRQPARDAAVPRGTPNAALAQGQHAQQYNYEQGLTGQAHCMYCDDDVQGRALPNPEGQPMLIHMNCPGGGQIEGQPEGSLYPRGGTYALPCAVLE